VPTSPVEPLAGKRSTTLWIATAIVLLEAVAIWAYIVYLAVETAGDDGSLQVIGFFGMYAVAFTVLGVGLWRRRKWTRAPLIVLQLLLSVVGFSMINGETPAPGAVLVVLAVVCAGLLLVSQTREALR
jgi:uncharacterized membrane protein YoaK (UPF0700 family)